MEPKVLSAQSLLDIAIQTTGAPQSALTLAIANNISITEALQAGCELTAVDVQDKQTHDYYTARALTPATDTPGDEKGGIGYMAIGIDFIVS